MKSRRVGQVGQKVMAAIAASLMGGSVQQKSYAPRWQGVIRKSVALQDHRGACNPVKRHKERQACARRRPKTYGDLY